MVGLKANGLKRHMVNHLKLVLRNRATHKHTSELTKYKSKITMEQNICS